MANNSIAHFPDIDPKFDEFYARKARPTALTQEEFLCGRKGITILLGRIQQTMGACLIASSLSYSLSSLAPHTFALIAIQSSTVGIVVALFATCCVVQFVFRVCLKHNESRYDAYLLQQIEHYRQAKQIVEGEVEEEDAGPGPALGQIFAAQIVNKEAHRETINTVEKIYDDYLIKTIGELGNSTDEAIQCAHRITNPDKRLEVLQGLIPKYDTYLSNLAKDYFRAGDQEIALSYISMIQNPESKANCLLECGCNYVQAQLGDQDPQIRNKALADAARLSKLIPIKETRDAFLLQIATRALEWCFPIDRIREFFIMSSESSPIPESEEFLQLLLNSYQATSCKAILDIILLFPDSSRPQYLQQFVQKWGSAIDVLTAGRAEWLHQNWSEEIAQSCRAEASLLRLYYMENLEHTRMLLPGYTAHRIIQEGVGDCATACEALDRLLAAPASTKAARRQQACYQVLRDYYTHLNRLKEAHGPNVLEGLNQRQVSSLADRVCSYHR